MAITYIWNVVQMDTYPEKDGLANVVFTVHWNVSGTDDTHPYQGYAYGSAGVTLNEEGTYIPYAELTKEQVIEWAKNSLGEEGVTGIEASIARQIADQVNPQVVSPTLPW